MGRLPAKAKTFSKEVDLCAAFIAAVDDRWVAYAETGGWDILLVRKVDGFQIGIEAKLKLNAEVLSQALEEYGAFNADGEGPDCRAILVPEEQSSWFGRIADYIGITVVKLSSSWRKGRLTIHPELPRYDNEWAGHDWYEWAPAKHCRLPEYIPDVAAGAKSPIKLTAWKVGALRLQALLERNGCLTREDFKTCKVDHRRWLAKDNGWLKIENGRIVAGKYFPDVARQHPIVYEQIKADMAYVKPAQGNLL
jgi:hypothetical protein